MPNLKDWSEENFIQFLKKKFFHPSSLIGIGDDAAVIPLNKKKGYLITTDALIEEIHFIKKKISPHDLGLKTVYVNVSDIAAMGGIPKFAFLTLGLPLETEKRWLEKFIEGIKEATQEYGINLLGGDTVGSKKHLFINLTLIGEAPLRSIKYRSSSKIQDIICVTGFLGDSSGGLKAIRQGLKITVDVQALIRAHSLPHIHLKEATWLSQYPEVHSMMDLSDGLDLDLKRILKASKKGATVDCDKLPLSDPLKQVCLKNHWDPISLAISGGEDYCLLLTIEKESFEKISSKYKRKFQKPLYPIGEVTKAPEEIVYRISNQKVQLNLKSFNHFAS